MQHHTGHIKVTNKDGKLTVDPHIHRMTLGLAVTWSLTPDSDPGTSLNIVMDDSWFKSREYAINHDGGFGLIAQNPGTHNYTVNTDGGTLSLDPVIIVDPIAPRPPHP